jgi:hypothetical protein
MSNIYAQAIQVLADSNIDFKALAYEIAKSNPSALVSAARRSASCLLWGCRHEH